MSEFVVYSDATNEQVVLAAALPKGEARTRLCRLVPSADFFLTPENAGGWALVLELERRGLDWDAETARRITGDAVDLKLLTDLVELRPEAPANLDWHVHQLLLDRSKATTLLGPFTALGEALRDKRVDRDKLVALARQVEASLRSAEPSLVRDPRQLTAEMMAGVRARYAGRAVYPYGIDGLDWWDSVEQAREHGITVEEGATRVRRCVPGTAPCNTTVLTAATKSGKTTVLGNLILGAAKQRRKVLVGSWEARSPLSLEFIACLSLCETDRRFARAVITAGEGAFTPEMDAALEKRATGLQRFVRFMDNPFFRGTKGRPSNEKHIELFSSAIAEWGAEVTIADLWNRMLTSGDDKFGAVDDALWRQQQQVQELRTHLFIVVQQRKDIELRANKKPTPEGLKGSGAYSEIADDFYGLHRPARWKRVADDRIEVMRFLARHRYGHPWAVALDYEPMTGVISGGRTVPYEQPEAEASGDDVDQFLRGPRRRKPGRD